jgi:hypothetical protein
LPELGLLVPLVVLLIFFSAWPAAVTDHTFGQQSSTPPVKRLLSSSSRVADYAPSGGWTAYAPSPRSTK